MRILRLVTIAPPAGGGMQRHVGELSIEQAAAGHAVTLVYALGGGGELPGVVQQPLPVAAVRSVSLQAWLLGRRAERWLRDSGQHFDLVHAHGDYAEAWWAARLARRMACPAVVTCHGGLGQPHRVKDRLRRIAFGRLTHLFCVSEEVARRIHALGVDVPATVQHSGTRVDWFTAEPRQESPEPSVVAVGSLVGVKGYDHLIPAIRGLQEHWPTLRVHVFGEGAEESRLRQDSADVPAIVWHGSGDRETVRRHLRRAWVFVQSSVDLPWINEGMPTSIVEALASGVPVVASAVGGVPQVVADGVTGFVVPQRAPEAMATAIERLLSDSDLRQKMGAAGNSAGAGADWPRVAAVITNVCEGLFVDR